MKTSLLLFAFATSFMFASVLSAESLAPVSGADSLGFPSRIIFQGDARTITAVQVIEDTLNVEFTGRWLSSSAAKFPEADKNAFAVSREKGVSSAAWDALGRRFSKCRGKSINILVFLTHGYLIRGGVPIFSFPQDRFEIILPGQEFNFPIGYQF